MYRPTYGYGEPSQNQQQAYQRRQQPQQPQTFQYSQSVSSSFNQRQQQSYSSTTTKSHNNYANFNTYLSTHSPINNINTHIPTNRSMSANDQAAVAASAVLRAESPQILHSRNDSSFSSHQYSNNSAIRQPNNNQVKSPLPTSPIQGHQLSQSFPNTENFSSQDIVEGLTHPTALNNGGSTNYNSIEISRTVNSPTLRGGNDLLTLPPLNSSNQSSPSHQESLNGDWPSSNNNHHDELARPATNSTPVSLSSSSQQDPSILMQYHNDNNRLVSSTYPQVQQQNQSEFFGEVGPYGCGVSGCFVSFNVSNELFHHMKSAHTNLDQEYKPYRCAMASCPKRYKNINGLQYHLREAKGSSGHGCIEGDNSNLNVKPYQCQVPGCKKAYRTTNGLRYHQVHGHNINQQATVNGLHTPSVPQQLPIQHTVINSQQQQALPQFRLQRDRWLLNNDI
ncbi:hypothetical protein G6F46_000405 [Rhizopus delemar]|uniref:C2H2-type domain-containing protein n=2 Tax=Rhizopus TaxID=4842 RepID=A0A9P6ZF71_9FUNG|nr:hypothetical protein G6F55_000851 [Rhizopus delemar]KAG1553231.1 hypothetical protein G6F51_000722 [Rhizopus arrhizus]KAG1505731.1 hypothetical protein G6F54_000099 [Rhizopus delemar]KAG1517492.1 hypothetical protein G6F53_001333 [Rhizopus delemar]KAG1528590.1 hypothetical protein G6F52_000511 [Rhizopus delemar]